MDISAIKEYLKISSRRAQDYVHRHYPELEQYILNHYTFTEDWKEKMFCWYNDISEPPKCKMCGAPIKFKYGIGYSTYCSCKCQNSDPDVKAKIKQTNLRKYGVENPFASDEIKKKIKQTNLEKYGVENPGQSQELQDKGRKTKLERYGYENEFSNPEVQARIKQTNLEKYGVENPFASDEIKKKIKQTNLKKYGVEYPTRSTLIRDKTKSTCIEKYGVENPALSKEIKEKIKQSFLEKYGVEHALQVPDFFEKYKQTMLEKYGVVYGVQLEKCQSSITNDSKPNQNFATLLASNNIIYSREFPLDYYIYDFKVGNILIEIDPSPTHNSTWGLFDNPKEANYHLSKTKTAESYGYQCIHVWDWDDINKVLDIIKPKISIGARKCDIREVSTKETNQFLRENHLQGTCNKQLLRYGLYYNDELIEIMTFGKPRYNKKYQWELLRLCTKSGYVVCGGAQRLFKHIITHHSIYRDIITYCDNSKFAGTTYKSLGFKKINSGQPTKHWYHIKTGIHITNNLLLQRGFDQLFNTDYGKGTSNEQLMIEHGFVEVYDCGQSVWAL